MSLEIVLDKHSGCFSPGETITGNIRITVDEERHIKYLTVDFNGRGRTKIFHEKYDKQQGEATQHFLINKAEEIYLEGLVVVSGGNKTIPPGTSDFPFEYTLPDSCLPCTFEISQDGALGGIYYWMVATMQTGAMDDMTVKVPFRVLAYLDLNNADINPYEKFTQTETFRFCCGCCKSKPVVVVLTIYKRTLIYGEPILFRVDTDNPSRRRVKAPLMELVNRVTCVAQGKVRMQEHVLLEIEGPVVEKKTRDSWFEKNFKVPAVNRSEIPPTDLGGGCSLIQCLYFLRFTMPRPRCDGRIEICSQILLGTVPLAIPLNELPPVEDTDLNRPKTSV